MAGLRGLGPPGNPDPCGAQGPPGNLPQAAPHEKAVLDKLKELGAQAEKGESTPADVKLRCPTCKADIGRMHDAACDVARCLSTGAQRAFDEHKIRDGKIEENHKCGRDVWTGYFPGEREAAQYGVPIMVLKEVGKWDEQEVAWVMPDNYQEIIQEKGLGPRISA